MLIDIRCAPWSSGFGHAPPAIIPHTCAASKSTLAPTESAISRTAATGCGVRLRLPPMVISFGRIAWASSASASTSTV